MQALLSQPRLLGPPPASVWGAPVLDLTLEDLSQLEKLLASSPHNRQLCVGGDTLNALLALLPEFPETERRATFLRIIRHLGHHRFTVHNTRFVLAAVARHLDAAAAGAAAPTSLSAIAAPPVATNSALELLRLFGDLLAGISGPGEMPSFWDMGAGGMRVPSLPYLLPPVPLTLASILARHPFASQSWVPLASTCPPSAS